MANHPTALVTGAAGGVGAVIVSELQSSGYHVIACDLDSDGLEKAADKYNWQRDQLDLFPFDVTSASQWEQTIKQVIAGHGKLELLFNVAGILRADWVHETPVDDIDPILSVNLKGTILGTKYAATEMIRQGSGHIINFSSILGLAPGPGMSVYTAAKYGVRGFSLSAAIELKPHGIHVTLICPDRIKTGLFNFPNATGPQTALAYSSPKALEAQKFVPPMLRKILKKKPRVLPVPAYRGHMARFTELLPVKIYDHLLAKGRKRQQKELDQ